MEFTIGKIAELLGAELVGDEHATVHTISEIQGGKPGSISFLANPKYLPYIYSTEATAVIVSKGFEPEEPISANLLKVEDPYKSFGDLLDFVSKLSFSHKTGIESQSFIDASAKVAEGVYVGAFAYISEGVEIGKDSKIYPNCYIGKNVKIGENTIVYPNVAIYHDCQVGNSCILHAGVRIGSDGFGFAPREDGSFQKLPHIGKIIIEDEVEIGANTTIDRATIGTTHIHKGVKLDNLVQIAHNVSIGQNSAVAAQSGISGSAKLGSNCIIAGQVGIVGHISLADGTQVGAQSGVSKTFEEKGSKLRGSPAQDIRKQLRAEALFRQLEQMRDRIKDLEKQIALGSNE